LSKLLLLSLPRGVGWLPLYPDLHPMMDHHKQDPSTLRQLMLTPERNRSLRSRRRMKTRPLNSKLLGRRIPRRRILRQGFHM
jgi:hypothetical protein